MLLCPNHCLRLNHCRWKKWFACNQILCTLQSLKLEKHFRYLQDSQYLGWHIYVTFTSICTEYFRHHSECEAAPGVVVLQRCHGGSSTSRRTEWTHIMVMVVSITITVERAFNCMKYSQRKNCRRNILWRFLHKKVLLRWKEKSVRNNVSSDHFFVNRSNLLQRIERTKTIFIFFDKLNPTCNGLKARKLFFLTN